MNDGQIGRWGSLGFVPRRAKGLGQRVPDFARVALAPLDPPYELEKLSLFDDPANPEHLIDSLLAFIETWNGGLPSWYGVSEEKLSAVSLPRPLRRLYAAVGNMPGERAYRSAFSHQDTLLPLEWLSSRGSQILFAIENQGCWRGYTEAQGDDPPVVFAFDEGEPEREGPSLANFLVTLCLQEITFGSPVTYAGDGLVEAFSNAGFRVTPLWLHGLFPIGNQLEPRTYHLVEGQAILLGDHWVGFRFDEDEERFSPSLRNARRIHPLEAVPVADWLNVPSISAFAKKMVYERLARQHQQQANLEQARADECRRLAAEVMNNEP